MRVQDDERRVADASGAAASIQSHQSAWRRLRSSSLPPAPPVTTSAPLTAAISRSGGGARLHVAFSTRFPPDDALAGAEEDDNGRCGPRHGHGHKEHHQPEEVVVGLRPAARPEVEEP
nr:unnamed protein product [Digitaria exilis]